MRAGTVAVVVLLGGVVELGAQEIGWDGWDAWRGTSGRSGTGRRRSGFSDEAVKDAIKKGCEYLWSRRGADGAWEPFGGGGNRQYIAGPSSLATYALLASGVSPLDKRMVSTLEWLGKQESVLTYTLGLRCNAWQLANRETGGKYQKFFREDLQKLLKSTRAGAYNYFCNSDGQSHGDNSNSQYGVLGTWAGAMAHQEIPLQYWQMVLEHWSGCQHGDGGWGYSGASGESTATMTAGGIATLYVCFDNLFADKFIRCNVATSHNQAIRKGLDWMDKNFEAAVGGNRLMGHGDLYYFLYGVERVGLASGFKYFGQHNWYKLGAERLLRQQLGDGSWPRGNRSPLVSTCFALLFLVRGRHAVAFNKLEYEGDWNNRPRDLAGLTRWMSGSLERQLSWQIISMKSPVEEWHDAPILYIAGSKDPNFSDAHIEKLKTFVQQGGTILSVTECGGRGFSRGIRKAYVRMLPDYKMKPAPLAHDVYRIHHRLTGRPAMYEISNGIRPLAIHTDADLSKSWQLQMRRTSATDFKAPSNVLMYVTDKGILRSRGVSLWPAKPEKAPPRTIKIVRVKHEGNWSPEPLAFERFGRLMAERHNVGIEQVEPVEVTGLDDSNATIAVMTGTRAFTMHLPARLKLRKWLQGGGTLIVDAAGGSRAFGESADAMLRGMFGRRGLRRLAASAPLYKLAKMEIQSVKYRRAARVDRGLRHEFNLRGVDVGGRFAVIFSKEDLTAGLVGYPSYRCVGYEPETCFQIMRNAILNAAGPTKPGTKDP